MLNLAVRNKKKICANNLANSVVKIGRDTVFNAVSAYCTGKLLSTGLKVILPHSIATTPGPFDSVKWYSSHSIVNMSESLVSGAMCGAYEAVHRKMTELNGQGPEYEIFPAEYVE